MNLRPEQLTQHLTSGPLKPIYLVTGDEPLLVQESSDSIRHAARHAGFSERTVFTHSPQFNWLELEQSGQTLSLFSERRLIELRIDSGKPGDAGSKALQAYCDNLSEDNLLMVIMPRLDKRTQSSKWCKALIDNGAFIQHWPIEADQLPRWLAQRAQKLDLRIPQEALKQLAWRVEGNLLAADQELAKLKMAFGTEPVTLEQVESAVADSARFNLFNLVDQALKGDTAGSLRTINGLKAEGNELLQIAWIITRDVRQLLAVADQIQQGTNAGQAMTRNGIWNNRQALVGQALRRLPVEKLEKTLMALAKVDQLAKGVGIGNGWDELENLLVNLSGKAVLAE